MRITLFIILFSVWTIGRHEGSHAFMAVLEGANIEEMRLLPGVHEELGFYFGYVKHSGDTTWLTDAAPFLADVLVMIVTSILVILWPGIPFKRAILILGFFSPLGDMIYNYQGGLWREGTDVWDLRLVVPDIYVHLYFLISIIAGFIGYFHLRK